MDKLHTFYQGKTRKSTKLINELINSVESLHNNYTNKIKEFQCRLSEKLI